MTLTILTVFIYSQTPHVRVVLHTIEGYGEYEAFAKRAAIALETVLNSNEFKERVLSGTATAGSL